MDSDNPASEKSPEQEIEQNLEIESLKAEIKSLKEAHEKLEKDLSSARELNKKLVMRMPVQDGTNLRVDSEEDTLEKFCEDLVKEINDSPRNGWIKHADTN